MNYKGLLAFVVVALLVFGLSAWADEVSLEGNLSADRTVGIGLQADFPWGGLLSARYWATPLLGGEVVVFVLGDGFDLSGTVTGRFLYRAVDSDKVDFYLAAGASVPFSAYGGGATVFSGVGGIEVNFSRRFAWNVEFGLAASTTGTVSTAFGTGLHFYF